jgi:hypothetical protein
VVWKNIFLKFLHAGALFSNSFYFTERRIFAPNDKFSNKNVDISAWRDSKKILCDVYRYGK